jgi:hypothetical protein
VFRPRSAVYQDVLEEDEDTMSEKQLQDGVHERLERRGHVGEAERHHQELEVAVMGAERRLVNVVWMHPHLMVPTAQIKLGEDRVLEFIW